MTGIPIDAHPDPVLAYAVDGDEPLVTETNDAFEAAFDGITAGAPVSTVFDLFTVVDSTGDERPETHLVRGDPAGVYLDGADDQGTYFARVAATDDGAGYLVFAALEDYLDIAETAGVGQVASVISHDLRNPLDVATAHLRAARETGEAEHFDAVADAHDRMGRIIRDVLMLARGPEVIDPSESISIEDAAEEAWGSVETEGATLTLSGPLPAPTADPDRVRRLLENLFRNSVEHGTPDGHGDDAAAPPNAGTEGETAPAGATVTVGSLDDGFYVADDGPGIPPEEQDAVFEPGYSTDNGGTGLGLAIVDEIAAAHGWDLTLTTSADGGARFEIRFR
jgi:signal transduction histidine kinase